MNTTNYRLHAARLFIVAFFLWHAFAVAVFSIPRDARDPYARLAHTYLLPVVSPYMLLASQWQLWNLFAPDPLRRVTTYQIHVERGNGWELLRTIAPGEIALHRHAARFKMLGNLFDDGIPRPRLLEHYLHLVCRQEQLPSGSGIRLLLMQYIIPVPPAAGDAGFWNRWTPASAPALLPQARCP